MYKYYYSIDVLSFYRLFAEWLSTICPRDTIYRLADNMSICRRLSEVAMYETEAWVYILSKLCRFNTANTVKYFGPPRYDSKFSLSTQSVKINVFGPWTRFSDWSGTIVSQEPDATPTLRPRHANDAGSKSTKVQRNVFDLQKGFCFKISVGALDALQSNGQRRVYD